VADEIGDARITNMIMLGAMLDITGALPQDTVFAALGRIVKSPRWLELDKRALDRGRTLYRDSLAAI